MQGYDEDDNGSDVDDLNLTNGRNAIIQKSGTWWIL